MSDIIVTFGDTLWYPVFQYVQNILITSEALKNKSEPLSELDIYHELLPHGITYHVFQSKYTLDDKLLSFIILGAKL